MLVPNDLSPSELNDGSRGGRIAPYDLRRSAAMTVGGLAAGGVMGTLSAMSTGNDVLSGGLLLAGSLALAARQALRRSRSETQSTIAAWWGAASVGIMLGLGEFTTDILWFGGLSWWGCAALGALLPHLARHDDDATR